jgi:hypothetical protein
MKLKQPVGKLTASRSQHVEQNRCREDRLEHSGRAPPSLNQAVNNKGFHHQNHEEHGRRAETCRAAKCRTLTPNCRAIVERRDCQAMQSPVLRLFWRHMFNGPRQGNRFACFGHSTCISAAGNTTLGINKAMAACRLGCGGRCFATASSSRAAEQSLARSVRAIPITIVTVGKGSSKGAELMAAEWADKLKR